MSNPQIEVVQYAGFAPQTTLSPLCAKVHMALRFKGLAYTTRNVSSPGQVKKANPRGRVPAVVIDGESFVDSTDILTELDRRFPDPPLLPADPRARAQVKILEDWADEVVYFYCVYLRWCVPENFERMRAEYFAPLLGAPLKWIVPALALRDVRGRTHGQGVGLKGKKVVQRELEECLDTVVTLLEASPFLVGEQLTRADIALAAEIDQLHVAKLGPEIAATINARPVLLAWLDRVHERAPSAA